MTTKSERISRLHGIIKLQTRALYACHAVLWNGYKPDSVAAEQARELILQALKTADPKGEGATLEALATKQRTPVCGTCNDTYETETGPCQACCPHDEYDHDICLDCGFERDPGIAIDRAMDALEDR